MTAALRRHYGAQWVDRRSTTSGTHLSLSPEALARIDALVGEKGRAKFVRDAVNALLDRVAPTPNNLVPPYIEHTNRLARLTPAGTAAVLDIVRKQGWAVTAANLGYEDPTEFLQALLGIRPLPLSALSFLVANNLGTYE